MVRVTPDTNEFISAEETAQKLKYHLEHVRRIMQEGSREGLNIGRTWVVMLELATGKEFAAVKLSTTPPTIGPILPRMNNDVYLLSTEVGTQNGLISRAHVP